MRRGAVWLTAFPLQSGHSSVKERAGDRIGTARAKRPMYIEGRGECAWRYNSPRRIARSNPVAIQRSRSWAGRDFDPHCPHAHPQNRGDRVVAGIASIFRRRDSRSSAGAGTECHHSKYSGVDFFRGHVYYTSASGLGGDLIIILRDPVDGFLSFYYWSRQRFMKREAINVRTTLAAKYSLDEFVRIRDVPELDAE